MYCSHEARDCNASGAKGNSAAEGSCAYWDQGAHCHKCGWSLGRCHPPPCLCLLLSCGYRHLRFHYDHDISILRAMIFKPHQWEVWISKSRLENCCTSKKYEYHFLNLSKPVLARSWGYLLMACLSWFCSPFFNLLGRHSLVATCLAMESVRKMNAIILEDWDL